MNECRLNSVAILVLIPLIIMASKYVPASWSEGPFNHNISGDFFNDANVVPNTMYFNNKTDYYTIWDDETNQYVTYSKESNTKLQTVVFNAPTQSDKALRVRVTGGWDNVVYREEGVGKVILAGASIAPSSHLDEEGLRIQAEYGCAGCHEI